MSTLFYVSYAALWLLLLTMGVLVLLLYRHFGMMSLGTLEGVQRDGLPIGSVAPPISGVTAAGQDTRWEPQARPAPAPPLRRPRLRAVRHRPPPRRAVGTSGERRPRDRGGRAGAEGRSGPVRRALPTRPFPAWPRTAAALLPVTGCASPRSGSSSAADGRVLAKGLCGDQVRLRGLLEAADLRDVAQALPAPAQPVQITPQTRCPPGSSSAVAAASNGVDGEDER